MPLLPGAEALAGAGIASSLAPANRGAAARMQFAETARAALLFDPQEAGALQRSLARLSKDASLRLRLGQGAHASIARLDLTWLGNARRVVGLAARAGSRAPA